MHSRYFLQVTGAPRSSKLRAKGSSLFWCLPQWIRIINRAPTLFFHMSGPLVSQLSSHETLFCTHRGIEYGNMENASVYREGNIGRNRPLFDNTSVFVNCWLSFPHSIMMLPKKNMSAFAYTILEAERLGCQAVREKEKEKKKFIHFREFDFPSHHEYQTSVTVCFLLKTVVIAWDEGVGLKMWQEVCLPLGVWKGMKCQGSPPSEHRVIHCQERNK